MQKVVGAFTKVPTGVKRDDDFVDRLSHRYTVVLLVVFTVIVSSQLYIGKPITCWCPKHFTGNWIKYTNSYCWVKNTYYLPFHEEIPTAEDPDGVREEVIYYQWMPFILLGQALFFFLPSAFWHGLNQKAGVDCDNILETAAKFSNAQKVEQKEKFLRLIVNQMDRFLTSRMSHRNPQGGVKVLQLFQNFTKTCCLCCGSRLGNYLVILFIFSKLLYCTNVIAQLFVMNSVLRTAYHIYGWEFVTNVANDDHWVNSEAFPRVTMCDFNIRRLGNVHRYTVQCVLPINMYTEKIYAFLWFWMVFVAFLSVLNLVTWILRIVMYKDRVNYIRYHLDKSDISEPLYPELEKESASAALVPKKPADFVDKYLLQDGVFILRLIGHNTNALTVSEVITALWIHWKNKPAKNPDHFD